MPISLKTSWARRSFRCLRVADVDRNADVALELVQTVTTESAPRLRMGREPCREMMAMRFAMTAADNSSSETNGQ